MLRYVYSLNRMENSVFFICKDDFQIKTINQLSHTTMWFVVILFVMFCFANKKRTDYIYYAAYKMQSFENVERLITVTYHMNSLTHTRTHKSNTDEIYTFTQSA